MMLKETQEKLYTGMLRTKYLDSSEGMDHTFKSVILAGVYDIKNLKLKLRPGEEQKFNSPWAGREHSSLLATANLNIASDFTVDMSFNPEEISTMLEDYENDYHTGMNIKMERVHLKLNHLNRGISMHEVKRIQIMDDYTIIVQFENGEEKVKDIKSLLDKVDFKPLNDIKLFKSAIIVDGAITWILSDGQEIDLCPDKTYETSEPIMSADLNL